MKKLFTILLTIITVSGWATSWGPVYPYTLKTEGGKVKCCAVPYGPDDGPYWPGQTFVYYKNKYLYTVEKYFTNPFFTSSNGQYLIEIDYQLGYREGSILYSDGKGGYTQDTVKYDGDAVTIYKDGIHFKTFSFHELHIDTSALKFNRTGYRWFDWSYSAKDTTYLQRKMEYSPAYLEGDTLFLIAADNQLISIKIPTGKIISRQPAYETLILHPDYPLIKLTRKIYKVRYPEGLPKLKGGKTVEHGLAELLHLKPSEGNQDSASLQIYFRSFLINKQGKCEDVDANPSKRSGIRNYFEHEYDHQLGDEIEKWIMQQTFVTRTIPRRPKKFQYSTLVYLK